MKPITNFGLATKSKLLQKNQTQKWLMDEIRSITGMYVDSSTLHKIFTGELHSKRLTAAICQVLEIDSPEDQQKGA